MNRQPALPIPFHSCITADEAEAIRAYVLARIGESFGNWRANSDELDGIGGRWVGLGHAIHAQGEVWISAERLYRYRRPRFKVTRGLI
ncbi:MAG: hypothetical protein ACR2PL_02405, partial [Dehalococcoidia bacterium]